VGSVNDRRSWFVDPDGRGRGEYGQAALFAEYADGGWAALSSGRLARLTPDGQERWGRPLDVRLTWSTSQPIVDAEGRIYATTFGGVVCYDSDGRLFFTTTLGPLQPYGVSMIADGTLACLVGSELVLLT
jgi:outer membrane protein assembly factor BamB